MLIPRTAHAASPIRRRTLSERVVVGQMTLAIIMMFLALTVTLIYLVHANRTATRGYAIKKLEREHAELQTRYEIATQHVADAKSLKSLERSEAVIDLVPVGSSAHYIETKNIAQK